MRAVHSCTELFLNGTYILWNTPKFSFLSNSFDIGNHLARSCHSWGRGGDL